MPTKCTWALQEQLTSCRARHKILMSCSCEANFGSAWATPRVAQRLTQYRYQYSPSFLSPCLYATQQQQLGFDILFGPKTFFDPLAPGQPNGAGRFTCGDCHTLDPTANAGVTTKPGFFGSNTLSAEGRDPDQRQDPRTCGICTNFGVDSCSCTFASSFCTLLESERFHSRVVRPDLRGKVLRERAEDFRPQRDAASGPRWWRLQGKSTQYGVLAR